MSALQPRDLVLAVDAGNTKTDAAVVRIADGEVLAVSRGGVGDIYSHAGPEAAAKVVVEVVEDALRSAHADVSQLAHAAFRLAGVDWPEDEAFWRDVVDRTWPGLSASIKNDGQLFTYIADPDGQGVSVVLGTGGAIGGAGPAGEFAASWWLQHAMGASGLMGEAIKAAALAGLGIGPRTRLETLLPELLQVADVGEVLHATTRRDSPWHYGRLAAFAPRVMELWGTDDVLTEIVRTMARHVAEYVGAVRLRCGLGDDFSVAVGGGMVCGAPQVGEIVRDQLNRLFPQARVVITTGTALDGAIRAALAEARPNPAPEVVPALREWHGAAGFMSLTPNSRIMIDSPALAELADDFSADLAAVTGLTLAVTQLSDPRPGDLILSTTGSETGPEGYLLKITDRVQLAGGGDAGVFYGTQTLLQILHSTPGHRSLPRGEARDRPQFAERGLLLDVGRKYWSPDHIVQMIRRLGYLRLNTLQLHFTDDNAFRLVSDRHPDLAAPQAYTKADLRRFEAAARRYHVNLIPEIELPAHAAAILRARPELGFDCPSLAGSTLDVTKPEARRLARELIDEFAPLFAGPEFHIATDEYPTGAAQSECGGLVRYAREHGFGSPADVFVDFINDLNRTVRAHGKTMVIWNWWDVDQEPTIHPDTSIKVEAWTTAAETTDDHTPQKYLAMGYRVVVSPSDTLYVTPGFPLLPDQRHLYENWTPLEHPRLDGYQLSVWANDVVEQTDEWFDRFLLRPLQIMADRTWGGPRRGRLADFLARADAVGTPPCPGPDDLG